MCARFEHEFIAIKLTSDKSYEVICICVICMCDKSYEVICMCVQGKE